jgi:hypothetical protein
VVVPAIAAHIRVIHRLRVELSDYNPLAQARQALSDDTAA